MSVFSLSSLKNSTNRHSAVNGNDLFVGRKCEKTKKNIFLRQGQLQVHPPCCTHRWPSSRFWVPQLKRCGCRQRDHWQNLFVLAAKTTRKNYWPGKAQPHQQLFASSQTHCCASTIIRPTTTARSFADDHRSSSRLFVR